MSVDRRTFLLGAGAITAVAPEVAIPAEESIIWGGWNTSQTSLAINAFWIRPLANGRYKVSIVTPLDWPQPVVEIHPLEELWIETRLTLHDAIKRGWRGGNDHTEWNRVFAPEVEAALQRLIEAS